MPNIGRLEEGDIQLLLKLAQVVNGYTSPLWRAVGLAIALLGSALAIAAGIALTVGTIGLATPVGMGIAVAGGIGVVSALASKGLFSYAKIPTGLSRDIIDFAEESKKVKPGLVN